MLNFALSPSGPATFVLVLAVMGMATMPSAHVTEAKVYYEKFGPYYQHDIFSRPNFTDLIDVRGYKRAEGFGAIAVFDDPITETPDINSKTIARIQGLHAVVSLDERNALITQTMQLPGGTLSFVGVFTFPTKTKPKSIYHCIGGTGEYQSVTEGTAEIEVYRSNQVTLDTILTITVYYRKEKGQR